MIYGLDGLWLCVLTNMEGSVRGVGYLNDMACRSSHSLVSRLRSLLKLITCPYVNLIELD